MRPLCFRKATITDLEQVHCLIEELESSSIERTKFAIAFETNLDQANIFYFVIEQSNQVIGFVSMHIQVLLHHQGKVAEIQELVLMSDARNKGYGKLVLDEMIRLAKSHNCVLIELAANKKRLDAHRFYAVAGWKQSHFKFTYELT